MNSTWRLAWFHLYRAVLVIRLADLIGAPHTVQPRGRKGSGTLSLNQVRTQGSHEFTAAVSRIGQCQRQLTTYKASPLTGSGGGVAQDSN
jgi:hypothetical protein